MCKKSEYLLIGFLVLIFPLMGCLRQQDTEFYDDFNQSIYDSNGFDRDGFDREGYDSDGFNRLGYDRSWYNREGYNLFGYDREGYSREGFNSLGFNREGFDRFGIDRRGFDRQGFDRAGFDRAGFDRAGLNRQGLNREGLRRQYPRGFWFRQHQNQQILWNFQNRPLFFALTEFQEDALIREKFVQLSLPRNQNPRQLINIINQDVNLVEERFLDKLSVLILNFQDLWNQMDPTLDQIIQFANSVPGSTAIQNGTIWELKRNAIARGLVHNFTDFRRLLGVVPASLTQSLYFLEARTHWFIESLRIILVQDNLSYRDVHDLKYLTQNIRFFQALNEHRGRLIALIDQTLERKRAEFPIRELEVLNARVRALHNQIRPAINPQSKFKFYLIRDQAAWANDRVDHGAACLICVDDLNHEHPGVTCPMHPRIAYHASEGCLIEYVRNQIREQRFPITCGDFENPHELPITEELLRNAGLSAPEIRAWKIHTLRSYYAELIRLQNGGVAQANPNPNPARAQVICTTADCGAIIFPENVRDQTRTHLCEVCEIERCYECGELPHPGRACGRAEGEAIPPPESRYRPCPYCLTITDREDGCNAIRCQNLTCGRDWHFNKGKPRRDSFLHEYEPDVNNPRPREFRVPGDPDYVAGRGMESAFPEHQGEIID